MITFIISLALLIIGYFVYGSYIEKTFGIDEKRLTPSQRMADGVDFVSFSWKKAFLVQLLNIAGTGPIFGAVAGALWGPAAFVWIVLGCVFGGMVHDFLSGMLSVRRDGNSITEIIGEFLGKQIKLLFIVFVLILLVLVGAVFITSPADILTNLTGIDKVYWVGLIVVYYLIATVLPIDKVIGRIYPFFGAILLIMAIGLLGGMFVTGKISSIPEFSFQNLHPKGVSIFPFLFLSIACGAVSGFHCTQAPMMARCIRNEKEAKRVFAGAMATEGVIALIWAAVSMSFFGGTEGLAVAGSIPVVVNTISMGMLGTVGGILALLGVVVCPITTGDTAFRSARLIVSDLFKFKQVAIGNRFLIAIPLLAVGVSLTFMDFTILWRYFAWANQTISIFPLWVGAIYLYQHKKNYIIAIIPAIFMTMVTLTYIIQAKEGLDLSINFAYLIASIMVAITIAAFYLTTKNDKIEKI